MNNTVLFYTSPGCASCRKAKKWLEDNHVNFIEKNIFSNLLSEAEIRYLLVRCENGTEDIISTRSKAYASLGDKLEDMSVLELTRFIQRNPSILKRPILLSVNSMVVGYDGDEITAMVPSERRQRNIDSLARLSLDDAASAVADRF